MKKTKKWLEWEKEYVEYIIPEDYFPEKTFKDIRDFIDERDLLFKMNIFEPYINEETFGILKIKNTQYLYVPDNKIFCTEKWFNKQIKEQGYVDFDLPYGKCSECGRPFDDLEEKPFKIEGLLEDKSLPKKIQDTLLFNITVFSIKHSDEEDD